MPVQPRRRGQSILDYDIEFLAFVKRQAEGT
jgi:hypothetical protein